MFEVVSELSHAQKYRNAMQPSRLTRHKATGRRYRIGLVTNPSSAESGVRVKGRLTSLATTPTVGEISNTAFRLGSCLVGNTARRAKTLNISHCAHRGEDGEEGPSDFRLRASLVLVVGRGTCHSASNE